MHRAKKQPLLRIVSCAAILLLATCLRFWNFHERLILFSDSARDALVGLGAVRAGEIPFTGSFSSAGPFVFGPMFYYLIMASQALLLGTPFAPWYVVAALSVVFVVVVSVAVARVAGTRSGLIALILSAISPAQVMRATALTQHSVVGIASACFLLFMVLYREKRTFRWAFLLGLSSGIAASLHYQALVLLVAGLLVVCVWPARWRKFARSPSPHSLRSGDGLTTATGLRPRGVSDPMGSHRKFANFADHQKGKSTLMAIIRDIVWYLAGAIIPFLPLLIWDAGQEWANVRNLLDYLLIGQYRIFVSRRWLTFLSDFLPTTWGQVIGGNKTIGLLLLLLVVFMTVASAARKGWVAPVRWASLVLGLLLVAARYYRGELFEGYLVALHPFILFLSAWAIWEVWKVQRFIGLMALFVIVAGSFRALVPIVAWDQSLVGPAERVVKEIQESGFTPVAPFDFQYYSSEFTYAVSYLLETRGLASSDGVPIGVCLWKCLPSLTRQLITDVPYMDRSYHVIIVDSDATDLTDRKLWTNVSARGTLEEVGFWWRKQPLKSNFSLSAFIRNDVLKRH